MVYFLGSEVPKLVTLYPHQLSNSTVSVGWHLTVQVSLTDTHLYYVQRILVKPMVPPEI